MNTNVFRSRALSNWGSWFRSIREQRGIKRSTLAKALGYKNMSKGCRRIVSWERGDGFPNDEHSTHIIRVLSLSQAEWLDAQHPIDQAHSKDRLFQHAQSKVEISVRQGCVENHKRLLQQVDEILETPNLSQIPIHGQHMGMMYVGGAVNMILGGLLSMWSEGLFQTERHYLLRGGGSPLSGRQTFVGFEKEEPHSVESLTSVYRPLAPSLGPLMQHVRQLKTEYSVWSLSQYLAVLGVDVPSVEIHTEDGLLGMYTPKNASLELSNSSEWGEGVTQFPLLRKDLKTQIKPSFSTSTVYGPSKEKGRLVVGNILTGQMGAWKGERWSFEGNSGSWTLRPGQICLNEIPLIYWERDLPSLVAQHLVFVYEGLEPLWGK